MISLSEVPVFIFLARPFVTTWLSLTLSPDLFKSFKVMAYKPHPLFLCVLFQGALRDLPVKISKHASGMKTHS